MVRRPQRPSPGKVSPLRQLKLNKEASLIRVLHLPGERLVRRPSSPSKAACLIYVLRPVERLVIRPLDQFKKASL